MLKLSHAILEGAQKVQQGFESYIRVKDNSVRCCAIGMARLGIGYYYKGNSYYLINSNINIDFPILDAINKDGLTLQEHIAYWNDDLKLPPHEIAMLVASLECKFERGETLDF